MAVLKESPWYQQIHTEGEQRSIQQGARRQLMRLWRRRFGKIPPQVEAKLEGESL